MRMINKASKRLALSVMICMAISVPLLISAVNAAPNYSESLDVKIKDAYLGANYQVAAKLLEEQMQDLRNTLREAKWDRINSKRGTLNQLYLKSVKLANLYAWRLEAPGKALAIHRETTELKRTNEDVKEGLPIELLFTGEIFEKRGEYSKALKYYKRFLDGMSALKLKSQDDISLFVGREITYLVKYRIDGINLKTRGKGGFTPLLYRLRLPSPTAVVQFMTLFLAPESMYGYPEAMADMPAHIKDSPESIGSMVANYTLAIQTSASTVDESSVKTLDAYLAKYPESYYSLSLRHLFYRHYLDNGESEKARALSDELERIAKKRGMEPLMGPDGRFSSPEKTWETYKSALASGDILTVMECHRSGQQGVLRAFKTIGRDNMKKIAVEIGDITKLEGNSREARYSIRRTVNGKELTANVHFSNIDGEWKMRLFSRP